MPQLIPSYWFLILVGSWTSFLIFIPPKIMAYIHPTEPTSQYTEPSSTEPWSWPWL